MKMLTLENTYKKTVGNNMSLTEGSPSNNLPDQGKHILSGELVAVFGYGTKVGKSYLIIYVFKY